MQPSNPMQARGSFSKPEQLKRSMDEHELTRGAPPQPAQQPPPEPAAELKPESIETKEATGEKSKPEETPEQKIEREEKERQEVILQAKTNLSKLLGIELTQDDLKTYLFKGLLSKEVVLVNGVMKGTFQTLRISDLQEIDIRMAEIRDQGKYTQQGLSNEEAIVTLSYSWTHADGRALGAKPSEREEKIRKMAGLFIEQVANARINFDTVVRLALQERNLIKK